MRVLLQSFQCGISTERSGWTKFSFLALFGVQISCNVHDTSIDSGHFQDPLPTISTVLLFSRTQWFSTVCDLFFPFILLFVHAARTKI